LYFSVAAAAPIAIPTLRIRQDDSRSPFEAVTDFGRCVYCPRSLGACNFDQIPSDHFGEGAACWIIGFDFGKSSAERLAQ
jgi:hypothetical protein